MDTRSHRLVTLEVIAPHVAVLIKEHEANRGIVADLWMPSDFADRFKEKYGEVPASALVALVYNTLTEDGLPSFHRLIATHMGEASVWALWNGIWTAEESRHGRALNVYLADAPQINMRAYDEMLFAYHVAGFYPAWEANPYRLLAYTVMQEKATQISHANVAGLVRSADLALAQMLGKIAQEEGRHCRFYTEVFRLILEFDAPRALQALASEVRSFAMPGTAIPGFGDYVYLAERSGIFTTKHFKSIVDGVIKSFHLRDIHLADVDGEKARKEILQFSKVLARQVNRAPSPEMRTLTFPFLQGETITL